MLVSQPGWMPPNRAPSVVLSTPLSWSRIQRHTAPETISGISQGSSRSERSTPESGNRWRKNTAMASPMPNWPAIEPIVNSAVFSTAVPKTAEAAMSR